MSEVMLEKQLIEIIKDKEMPEYIKLAKLDMLVSLGGDVNTTYNVKSPLFIAKEQKLEKVYEFLRQNGAKEFFDENKAKELGLKLIEAIEDGKTEKAIELIEIGADVNAKKRVRIGANWEEEYHSFHVLYFAISNEMDEVVKLLIENGTNLDEEDDYGNTALVKAVSAGRLDIAKLLIENGANLDAKNYKGDTALITAAYNGCVDIVEELIEAGADVNVKNNDGWTALMRASRWNKKDVVKLLIEKGADVNAKNDEGRTALDLAPTGEIRDVIQCTGIKEKELGLELLAECRKDSDFDINVAKELIEKGADVNAIDRFNTTALMWASCKGRREFAEFLIEKGADVNAKGMSGLPAMMIAKDEEMRKVIIEAVKKRNIKENGKILGGIKNWFERG